MNVVFLGLGGNVGKTVALFTEAKQLIEFSCGVIQSHSSIYETEAWGLKTLNKFLNQVIKIHTPLNSSELINQLLEIEYKLGRVREGSAYTNRLIDIDILLFNDEIIETEALIIPHPRMHLRKFVLIPLNEIEGNLKHPILNKSIHDLLLICEDESEVHRYQS